MGLGAPKRRNKLSHDPNNTAWTRDTTSFGHKILSKQGWKPGDYLGAENASHSEHYTAANASHIRVLLREDNLGLGAQVGKTNAETFGLSLFSGVLGRLNGKTDVEVQKQQDALRDAELRTFQARKHGLINFVSAGFLVGDRIQDAAEDGDKEGQKGDKSERKSKKRKVDDKGSEVPEKKSKKAKRSAEEEQPASDRDIKPKKTKRKHRAEKDTEDEETNPQPEQKESDDDQEPVEAEKQSKKNRRKTKESTDESDSKSLRKQEKRVRKEERRKRKEEKRRLKSERESETAVAAKPAQQELSSGGRHAVRQRYIQQKRMASMDARAMKEIFMVNVAG